MSERQFTWIVCLSAYGSYNVILGITSQFGSYLFPGMYVCQFLAVDWYNIITAALERQRGTAATAVFQV